MKKLVYLFFSLSLASCSSHKYAAHFMRYDRTENYASERLSNQSTLPSAIAPETLTASLESKPILVENAKSQSTTKKSLTRLTKQERKLVKAEIKKEIKQLTNKKSTNAAKVLNTSGSWDQDLKMAAIFGVVGLVALIIGTSLFNVIGAISLIIGAVFLVKWIIRQ